MRRTKRFAWGKTLMPAGFTPAAQIKSKGLPPDPGPVGWSAGTQAEDALTMKRDYRRFLTGEA